MIDPLDGTTNYAHGFPWFCVSIGLEVEGEAVLGVIYHVMMDELFTAMKREGRLPEWQGAAGLPARSRSRVAFSPPDFRTTGPGTTRTTSSTSSTSTWSAGVCAGPGLRL